MKKIYLIVLFIVGYVTVQNSSAQRYTSEVFASADVAQNIIYGSNWRYNLGPATFMDLKMDVYSPHGDTAMKRPLIIMIHTGSFLPVVINNAPTGSYRDSTIVEMSTQFAKRGYTVAAIDYRVGWNPTASGAAGQDIRTGTLLQAVYRCIQDVKACVRYFKKDFTEAGNSFKIDTSKIVVGGMGSGGYVALAYSMLTDPAQISLPKFLSSATDPNYEFQAGFSYVNQSIWGDYDGFGGDTAHNYPNNSVGYSGNVQMIFNCGGASGDSSWIIPGIVPTVCFHVPNDPYANYHEGMVIVPTTGDPVLWAFGSYYVIDKMNSLGNNDAFTSYTYNDAYTTRANLVNDGLDGLFPFVLPDPGPPLNGQAAPWEWYDSTALKNIALQLYGSTGPGMDSYNVGISTNPDMSKAKALAYIDTIMGYLNPRVVHTLGLNVGINEINVNEKSFSVFPNPAVDQFTVNITDSKEIISSIELTDIVGRLVKRIEQPRGNNFIFKKDNLESGIYFVKVQFAGGVVTKKITLQ